MARTALSSARTARSVARTAMGVNRSGAQSTISQAGSWIDKITSASTVVGNLNSATLETLDDAMDLVGETMYPFGDESAAADIGSMLHYTNADNGVCRYQPTLSSTDLSDIRDGKRALCRLLWIDDQMADGRLSGPPWQDSANEGAPQPDGFKHFIGAAVGGRLARWDAMSIIGVSMSCWIGRVLCIENTVSDTTVSADWDSDNDARYLEWNPTDATEPLNPPFDFLIGPMWMLPKVRPSITIQQDDTARSADTTAFIDGLNDRGLKGCLGVVTSNIGVLGPTIANLQTWHGQGHEMLVHSGPFYRHNSGSGNTYLGVVADMIDDLNTTRKWLRANSLVGAEDHIVYGGGQGGVLLSRELEVQKYKSACAGSLADNDEGAALQVLHPTSGKIMNKYALTRFGQEDPSAGAANLYGFKGAIDAAMNYGGNLIINFHTFDGLGGDASRVSVAEYEEILDYIKLNKERGKLDVITQTELDFRLKTGTIPRLSA